MSLDETSRALLDSAVESSFVMDVSGFVLAANDAAAKLHGMNKAEDIEQSNIYELLPDEVQITRKAKVQDAIDKVVSIRFEEEVDGRALVHSIVRSSNPWGEVVRLAYPPLI